MHGTPLPASRAESLNPASEVPHAKPPSRSQVGQLPIRDARLRSAHGAPMAAVAKCRPTSGSTFVGPPPSAIGSRCGRRRGLHGRRWLVCLRQHLRRDSLSPSLASLARAAPPSDGPMRRRHRRGMGARDGGRHDYADAQRRGHPVTLLVSETTGALSPTFVRLLSSLARQASAPTTHDSTCYGTARSIASLLPPPPPCRHLRGHRPRRCHVHLPRRRVALSWRLSLGLAP